MALRIRLSRAGSVKRPYYKVVVADSRMPRDGRFVEIVGVYDPKKNPSLIEINKEKTIKWLEKGAKPSDSVGNLLRIAGIGKINKTTQEVTS
ncbi:MAG: 30S ribosomal protein S16 [Actinobacteria bacterium]|nr:30S ribosomal protein S16 [Actinomycetota bacterium]